MIQLYHNDISTCAQKVRLVLAEAQIPWEGHHLSLRDNDHLRPEYLTINPKGQVPAIVDGDVVVVESTVIAEYLVDSCDCRALLPATPPGRARMRAWTRQIDEDVFAAIAVISQAIAFRRPPNAIDEGEVARTIAAIPDEARREMRQTGGRLGMANPALPIAARRLDWLLGEMDMVLAPSEWLAGETLSLADIGLLPFVLRLDHLALSMMFEARPHLARWYNAMKLRRSFETAVSDWLHADLLERWALSGIGARPLIAEMLIRR